MKKSILIINRWNDEISRYGEIINHSLNDVYYITNQNGAGVVPEEAKSHITVDDLLNYDEILKIASGFIPRSEKFWRILALSEFDLLSAARLREDLGVDGDKVNTVLRFRDKVLMKEELLENGILTPNFIALQDLTDLNKIALLGVPPFILKPRKGAASQGVIKVDSLEDLRFQLDQLSLADWDEYQIEQYIDGEIFHVDGLVKDGEIIFLTASKYINTCLGFNYGKPLGSVMIDDVNLKNDIMRFTEKIIKGLKYHAGAFHLEIIKGINGYFYFLEIGARIGGGEIPYLADRLLGINLVRTCIDILLEQETDYINEINSTLIGGFLMMPFVHSQESRVLKVDSMKNLIQGLLEEKLPKIGQILVPNGGYDEIAGRFIFSGNTSIEVEEKIHYVINNYNIQFEKTYPIKIKEKINAEYCT